MLQLTRTKAAFYHLYPGVLITSGFIFFGPTAVKFGFPPQFGMLISILLIALPVMLLHLQRAKNAEKKKSIRELNGLTQKLSPARLTAYSIALVLIAFTIWGITQPLNNILSGKLLSWLPDWFGVENFDGYSKKAIGITLLINLLLNGILAPMVEELYFRSYLLPRMASFGRSAALVNTILFSLYHFWQPYIYITLIFSLLPMVWLVWKTKDIRLAIRTHSLLNITGAILSFAMLSR
jgi:uncharacterized protein